MGRTDKDVEDLIMVLCVGILNWGCMQKNKHTNKLNIYFWLLPSSYRHIYSKYILKQTEIIILHGDNFH